LRWGNKKEAAIGSLLIFGAKKKVDVDICGAGRKVG
jgi:hypothetical protein